MFQTLLITGQHALNSRVERSCERLSLELAACDLELDALGVPDVETLLKTAERTGAQAIYAERISACGRRDLAASVRAADLTFVGPSPETLTLLADKTAMKEVATTAGMGVVEGIGPITEWRSETAAALDAIGYPVVVKPVAGSGGGGISFANDAAEAEAAVEQAAAHGATHFGDNRVLVERCWSRARELEVTVAIDKKGRTATLPERETTLRHDGLPWLIESPSSIFTLERHGDEAHAALIEGAIELAQAFQLVGVATFEFLVDVNGRMCFLEANAGSPKAPLLTEMSAELDASELELRIAAGEPLPQEGPLRGGGHGFEALLWSEMDLSAGEVKLKEVVFPQAPVRRARGEAAMMVGEAISPESPLLARVATMAPIRHQAMLQLDRFLAESTLKPEPHTVSQLRRCLGHESFRAGQIDFATTSRVLASK